MYRCHCEVHLSDDGKSGVEIVVEAHEPHRIEGLYDSQTPTIKTIPTAHSRKSALNLTTTPKRSNEMKGRQTHALINPPTSHRQQLVPPRRTLLIRPIRMQKRLPHSIRSLLPQPPIRVQRHRRRNANIQPLSPRMFMSPWTPWPWWSVPS